MTALTRREFIQKTAAGGAVAGFLAASGVKLHANPLGLPFGSETYPHRARRQSGDLGGLLKDMKAIGIEVIELCSPTYREYAVLAEGEQTRKMLDDAGMKCICA